MMSIQASIQNIAILANPRAGGGNALKIADWLKSSLDVININNHIYSDYWPTFEQLNNYSDCWIIGGDGTINYFINKYPNCKIALALFDSGTGNDFAWKIYGNTGLAARFEQVMQGSPQPIDAGKINHQLYINCIGVGFDGEIIKSMSAIRFLGGKIGYLLAVILKIISFKEKSFFIQSDHLQFQGKFLLAFIVNSSRAGGGFYIAPNASIQDGYLDMILCEALPVWKRLIYLPIIKSGKHMHLPFVKQALGKAFTIQCKEEMPIQVDGELIYAKDVEVRVLEKQFNFRY